MRLIRRVADECNCEMEHEKHHSGDMDLHSSKIARIHNLHPHETLVAPSHHTSQSSIPLPYRMEVQIASTLALLIKSISDKNVQVSGLKFLVEKGSEGLLSLFSL